MEAIREVIEVKVESTATVVLLRYENLQELEQIPFMSMPNHADTKYFRIHNTTWALSEFEELDATTLITSEIGYRPVNRVKAVGACRSIWVKEHVGGTHAEVYVTKPC